MTPVPSQRFKILLAASEVVGFAKTGGLADVAGSLPRALEQRGHECAVVMPLYRACRQGKIAIEPTEITLDIPIGDRSRHGRVWRSTLPDSHVPVFLIEQPDLFERDDPAQGQGLYQFTLPNGQKRDYQDNCERFVFFDRAVLECIRLLHFWPDILHNNDWQTGLIPVFLDQIYRHQPGYSSIKTLFTIHNIAYQGMFWHWDLPLTGLDWNLFNFRQLEFYGQLNFLKAGIVFSDVITTVSPRYAQEIQTPYFACGLDGVLGERRDRLFGIVNGVDYSVWDPSHDPFLAANYTADTVDAGKALCKSALQKRYNLREEARVPLIGIVSRLADQKGIHLVGKSADAILQQDTQLVVLGEGDSVYHRMLLDLRARYPDRVGITLSFDEPLAHQIEGGADIFLMPSMYEPSGLNQLYSLRYGTVPLVRLTGGLADTIADASPENLAEGKANGFTFVPPTGQALKEAVSRAVDMYRNQPDAWRQLQRVGMTQDWSWNHSAAEYERIYAGMVGESALTRSA